MLTLTLAICASIFLSPVFSSSTSPCGSCHGGYSQYLDILEGNAGNTLPSTLSVGQTSTVRVVIENRVNTATNTALSSVSLTLTSQNGHFTVASPTYTVGTLQKGTATATWQITAVSAGADSLVIRASGRNSHQSLSFSDSYSSAPVITVSSPPPPPPSTYTVTVQSSPNGATSPTAGAYAYNSGTIVTLTATPNAGYQFASWTVNGASNTANPLTLTVTSATTITPVFTLIPLPTYTVTLQSSINGATSPAAGTYTYTSENSVTFTAAPSSGYQFDSWTVNGATYMNNPLTITITVDTTVTPNFLLIPPPPSPPPTPTTYTVTIQASPNGSTTPAAGTYTYMWGSPATFTATPIAGCSFDHWIVKNASNTANPLDLTITSDLVISPVFKTLSPPPPIVPIHTTNTVTVQPAPNGTTIPSAGTYNYTSGSLVALNAMPNAGHKFDYWVINGVAITTNSITLIANSDLTITAVFKLPPPPVTTYTVTMQLSSNGTTAPTTGIYSYPLGGSIAFAATPNVGYNFDYWLFNGVTNRTNPAILTIASNLEIYPVFTQVEQTPPSTSFTVTLQSSINGTITPPPGIYSRTAGDTMTLAATPNTNYRFDNWLIDGAINATNPLTLDVTSDATVVPIFSLAISPPIAPTPTVQENQTATKPLTNLTITIVSPTAGEKWQAGTTHKIEWNTSGGTKPLNIALEYASSSTSRKWIVIANNLANNGSLIWRVPSVSTTCYIRASVTDAKTEPQSATAQVEIEIGPVIQNFPAFLSAAMLLPFVVIAAFFQKRENASIKSTPDSSKQ